MTAASSGAVSPYRGLAAFGDTDLDARLFFGRERETEIVAANVQASRLTVLYGASGVGKSSLLRAGVAHRMRHGGPDDPRHVVVVCGEWRGDAVATVSAAADEAVAAATGRAVDLGDGLSLADRLQVLTGMLDGEIYLVLDQLEEYLLYHGADRGGPLAEALAEIVARPSLRVGVLLGIRDDALAQLDALKARVPALFGNLLRLDHLTREEGREAIVGPLGELAAAGDVAVTAEPSLVDAVLDQVSTGRIAVSEGRGVVPEQAANGRIEAPFLQLVMERLWEVERERGSTLLRAATLAELGGAERIVEEHLEGALAALDPAGRNLAAAVFGFLVTPSGTKIAHAASDLAGYAGVPTEELQPVLDHLSAERVLRPVADERGGPLRYEIYHDVLAAAVLGWSVRHEAERELERTRAQARRRHRRLVAVTAFAVVGLAAVTGLAVWALAERGNAQQRTTEAKAHELEARAVNLLPTDPGLALALAAEAARLSPGDTSEVALRQALLADHLVQVLPMGGGPVVDVEFEPVDQVWAANSDGIARYFQSRPFRLALEARHAKPVTRVLPAFGGMATASLDQTARISVTDDMAALGERPALMRHPEPVVTMVDGVACRGGVRECLATGAGRSVRSWDAATGRLIDDVPLKSVVREIVRLPSGRVAVRGADAVVRVVDLRRGRVAARWNARGRIDSIAAHPTRELVAVGMKDGDVRLWDAAKRVPVARYLTHGKQVLDVDLAGDLLLSGSADGSVVLRDLVTGRPIPMPGGHSNHVLAVELSRDLRYALTASSDGTAKVWEIPGGRMVALLAGHDDAVLDAVFSDDGRRVVTGSRDGTARVWRSGTQPELRSSAGRAPAAPAATVSSPGGARATIDGDTVRLETADGTTVVLRGHRDAVNSVAFSEDGARIVTASRDHDARIWDARSGALVLALAGRHSGSVADARFSPDGRWVVTAGPVTVGLWNAQTGDFVTLLRGPRSKLRAIAFAPDSRTISTSEADGTVRRFRCAWCGRADELLALASARMRATRRTLTDEERARYLG